MEEKIRKAMESIEPQAGARERIRAAAQRKAERRTLVRRRVMRFAASAAGLLVVLSIGGLLLLREGPAKRLGVSPATGLACPEPPTGASEVEYRADGTVAFSYGGRRYEVQAVSAASSSGAADDGMKVYQTAGQGEAMKGDEEHAGGSSDGMIGSGYRGQAAEEEAVVWEVDGVECRITSPDGATKEQLWEMAEKMGA